MKITFNKPPFVGKELTYIQDAIESRNLSGNGKYTQKCEGWFRENLGCDAAIFTPSCTHALEMIAILINTKPGDEVIMPSFTFVSTANAFVMRGARITFVDVNPLTMTLCPDALAEAISTKTKAVVAVHYAGAPCDMDAIKQLTDDFGVYLIEDAAQAICTHYKGKPLGTIGDFGAFSFHETKNLSSGGEGGLLIVNKAEFSERAEIIREKGTNRKQFFEGSVDKYSWVDIGSSFLASELQTAYLWGQLENANDICQNRIASWNYYYKNLLSLDDKITLPHALVDSSHNGHIFYIKTKTAMERKSLLQFLNEREIKATFHYVPLHSSEAGMRYGQFSGIDRYTTTESERLLRLPLWYNMPRAQQDIVIEGLKAFFERTD